MKKLIVITVITICLALCAAVPPQNEAAEKTPAPVHEAAVSAPEPTVALATTEVGTIPPAAEEGIEIPQAEPLHEVIPEPEVGPEEALTSPEVQSMPEAEVKPEPVLVSAPSQTVTTPQPGGMFYVPGFGWLESQGAGEVIYAENIYENGNKVGSMG